MGKNPAFQFYVRDWLSDPQLKMVSFQSKGIWMDFLCYLWESPDRGTIQGPAEKLCRMLGCTQEEWDLFITEASITKFANVTICNGIVTVTNRRMYREEKERKNTRLRVGRYREKRGCNTVSNANITVPSSSSSSSSILKEPPYPPNPDPVDNSKPEELFQREKNCTETQRHKIEELTINLTEYWHTCQKWVKDNILQAHPEAIILTLIEIEKYRPKNPYSYADKILARQSGNLRARDFYAKEESWKKEILRFVRPDESDGTK